MSARHLLGYDKSVTSVNLKPSHTWVPTRLKNVQDIISQAMIEMNTTGGKKFTLRDMAITQNREKLSHNESVELVERFVLVIGSQNSGKTSLINQMLQMDRGSSKPASNTYLLEYKYGRQMGIPSLTGNTCHIWELGSGTTFVSLLPAIVKRQQPTPVVLMLDLTSLELIVETAETLLHTLRSLLTKSSENEEKTLNESSQESDIRWRPLPNSLVIIGGKYDLFQNFEPAKKRIICQYLRCLAHIMQADLFFYSKNDSKLVKSVREALLQYAFGIPVNKINIVTDHNKPLYIPTGHDSISNIEGSPVTSVDHALYKYKNNLLALCSEQQSNRHLKAIPEDPAKDTNFLERVIDNLCAQKKEVIPFEAPVFPLMELERIQEENRRKAAAIESMRVTKILKN